MILNTAKYKRGKKNPQSHSFWSEQGNYSIKRTSSQRCTGLCWNEESDEN